MVVLEQAFPLEVILREMVFEGNVLGLVDALPMFFALFYQASIFGYLYSLVCRAPTSFSSTIGQQLAVSNISFPSPDFSS